MAATNFFPISTSDRGDFPRIIVIDLFFVILEFQVALHIYDTIELILFTQGKTMVGIEPEGKFCKYDNFALYPR